MGHLPHPDAALKDPDAHSSRREAKNTDADETGGRALWGTLVPFPPGSTMDDTLSRIARALDAPYLELAHALVGNVARARNRRPRNLPA